MHSLKALVISLLALAQGSAAEVTKTKTKTITIIRRHTTTIHRTATSTVVVPSSTDYTSTVTVTVPTTHGFIVASDSAQQTGDGKLARRMDAVHKVEEAAPLDARAAKTKTKTITKTKTRTEVETVTAISYKTTTITSGVVKAKTTTSVYAACSGSSGNIIGGNLNNPPGGYYIYEIDSTDSTVPFSNAYSADGTFDCCNICFSTPGCFYGFYIAFYNTCGLWVDTAFKCNQATTPPANITVNNDQTQNVNIQVFNGPCAVAQLG